MNYACNFVGPLTYIYRGKTVDWARVRGLMYQDCNWLNQGGSFKGTSSTPAGQIPTPASQILLGGPRIIRSRVRSTQALHAITTEGLKNIYI